MAEPDDQDKWLEERIASAEASADAEPPSEPEAAQELAGDTDEPDEDQPEAKAAPAPAAAALAADDEEFAFQWLARGRLPRQEINALLAEKPQLALAMARALKDNQDTIARLRRGSASQDEDDARPSDSAPGRTTPASPEELRRARVLQLVEDEEGEEARQALERDWRPGGAEERGGSPAVDPRTIAELAAARERLVAKGHDELRGKAEFGKVLRAADALRAADPTLGVGQAIDEAAEIVRLQTERGLADSQQRKRAIASTQPVTSRGRGAPLGLSKEQARDRHLDALIAGNRDEAEALVRRYKLNER
jgi:hypothetical protein